MNPGQLNPWLALQDVIGPMSTFPRFIRRLFWKRELYYRERFSIALFGWMNGVHPDFLVEVLIFCGFHMIIVIMLCNGKSAQETAKCLNWLSFALRE